ncbi:MAG: MFS transporter [Candidatus Eisenbacteria bacterium]|nr:MFS transporter [Candidatus Eisenbacteria bacterium]
MNAPGSSKPSASARPPNGARSGRRFLWPGANLPRAVIAVGVVSFLTDFSSEMIYPLLPAFLTAVLGAGAVAIGLIEGVAESTASLLKLVSGYWTDRVHRRKPFLLAGYGLAGLARPLIGLALSWPFVLALRFLDRVGKGLRTSPRDALIADVTDPRQRGAAYGLHRAMDHAGAVAGPLAAAGLLLIPGVTLPHIFFLAAIPAALVIIVILAFVHEPRAHTAKPAPTAPSSPSAPPGRGIPPAMPLPHSPVEKDSRREIGALLVAVLLFTLGNSTDAFLLLRLGEAGYSSSSIALLWAFHNLVRMISAYFGGALSDRTGRRTLVLSGWAFYALIYLAFGWIHSPTALIPVFLAYGIFFGLSEPAEKAWIADLSPSTHRGRLFGFYNLAVGLGALPASLLFGWIWKSYGSTAAFTMGAGFAALSSVLLVVGTKGRMTRAKR